VHEKLTIEYPGSNASTSQDGDVPDVALFVAPVLDRRPKPQQLGSVTNIFGGEAVVFEPKIEAPLLLRDGFVLDLKKQKLRTVEGEKDADAEILITLVKFWTKSGYFDMGIKSECEILVNIKDRFGNIKYSSVATGERFLDTYRSSVNLSHPYAAYEDGLESAMEQAVRHVFQDPEFTKSLWTIDKATSKRS
jgi:hypothetical protein